MTANTCTLRLNKSFELALVMAKMEAETKCGMASSEAAANTYTKTDTKESVQLPAPWVVILIEINCSKCWVDLKPSVEAAACVHTMQMSILLQT